MRRSLQKNNNAMGPMTERLRAIAYPANGEGELTLWCRGPLVLYALHELGVNPHHVEPAPRAQQVEIANAQALAPWIDWS